MAATADKVIDRDVLRRGRDISRNEQLVKANNSPDNCAICFDDDPADFPAKKCMQCGQYVCKHCRTFDGVRNYKCVTCQHRIHYVS